MREKERSLQAITPNASIRMPNGWMSLTNFLSNWFELLNNMRAKKNSCVLAHVCPLHSSKWSEWYTEKCLECEHSALCAHSYNKIVAPKHWNQGVYNLINCLSLGLSVCVCALRSEYPFLRPKRLGCGEHHLSTMKIAQIHSNA